MTRGQTRLVTAAAIGLGLAPIVPLVIGSAQSRLSVLAIAVAIGAAFHGFGRVVAWLVGDEDAPVALVIAWGAAAYVGVAGILLALHLLGPATRIGLVAAGCVLGARWFAMNATSVVDAVRTRVTARGALAAATSALVIGFVVVAAAGNWHGAFIDAETGYLGQLRRLDDTGALHDPIGFPRAAGLGGQVVLAALAGPLDLRAAHLVDRGVMFALAIALAVSLVRRRRGAAALAAVVLPVALLAVPDFPDDMAPHWSIVAFVLAAALALDRAREHGTRGGALGVILIAAAALTLRHALAPLSFALAIAVIHDRRALWKPAAVVAAVVVVPYIAAAVWARLAAPTATVFSSALAGGAAARIGLWLGIGGVLAVIVALAIPRTAGPIRTTALAACASLAGAGLLSPGATAAWQVALPLAIAIVIVLGLAVVAEPAEDAAPTRRPPLASAAIVAGLVVGVLPMARFVAGQPLLTYQLRTAKMLDDARAVGDLPRSETTRVAADYDAVQRTIPAGARVGIWVDRGDLVRYDTHAIVDLRTPTARRCVGADPRPRRCDELERTVAGLGLRYLLVADPALPPVDPIAPLARFVPAGRVTVARGGVAVIDLAAD